MKYKLIGLSIFVCILFISNLANACCKTCSSNSQACGDSCISLSYTCHQPDGCACDSGGGGGGGGEPDPTPTPDPKPKYKRTSRAVAILDILTLDGIECGFNPDLGDWKPGRTLGSGLFLFLTTEIRNVNYLANFYEGDLSEKYLTIKAKLKSRLKRKGPLCDSIV